MLTKLKLAVAMVAACLATTAGAATVTLSGTIRDFNASHPDFEGTIGGLQTGQVRNVIGKDDKPEWKGNAKSGFTNKANFEQWYRDVPGVNQSKAFDLKLSDAGSPGTYKYTNSSFFPIDGQLFGNEGRSHNYHFTLELAGKFSFQNGDFLTFNGDDDLWIFFGGKLGIDLGGVHSAAGSTITSADLKTLGLKTGVEYDLNIFFAERHTTQSNFSLTTNFDFPAATPVPLPGSLPLLAGALVAGFALKRRRG